MNAYNKMQQELYNSINQKKFISIEAVESVGQTILPIAISKLKKVYDSHTININNIDCCSHTNLLNNVRDIFICYHKPDDNNGIISKSLGTDEIFLVADKNFPINTITKDEIFNLPLILASDKKCLKKSLSKELGCTEEELDKANILYKTNSYFSALNGVLSAKAVAFIPASIYHNYCPSTRIKRINIEDFSIELTLYICYLDSFYKTNSDFIKSLKNILKGYLN